MKRYEIRIAGFGGQGVITLSKMIAHASAMHANLIVAQTEAYSAAARGGKAWAEVVIDLDPNSKIIDYPKAMVPYDFVIILSSLAADEVKATMIKKELDTGYMIWDNGLIEKFKTAQKVKALGFPLQQLATEKFGNAIFGNSILFGAFTKISGIFTLDAAKETLEEFVPKNSLAKNIEAFQLGWTKGEEFLKNLLSAEGQN